jgi:hypothetical protein
MRGFIDSRFVLQGLYKVVPLPSLIHYRSQAKKKVRQRQLRRKKLSISVDELFGEEMVEVSVGKILYYALLCTTKSKGWEWQVVLRRPATPPDFSSVLLDA